MDQRELNCYVDIHTHKASQQCRGHLCIQNLFYQDALSHPQIEAPVSIGLHPWHIADYKLDIRLLSTLVDHPMIAAIGEVGLDRLNENPLEAQLQAFKQQIDLAEQKELPLVIHCVKAFNEIIEMKKAIQPKQPWIIHGFRGKPGLVDQLIDAGFYISFGPAILTAGSSLKKALLSTPLDALFLETDDSGLPLEEIYQSAAEILRIPESELKRFINQNFLSVFERYAKLRLEGKN